MIESNSGDKSTGVIARSVLYTYRISARPIDLVDDDDRHAPQRERLAEHEARLRHGTVERIDDEQHTVDHAQDALHLATEVGVARGVDDVDLRFLPPNGSVLREDGDTALTLERVRVHDALGDDLVGLESSRLTQHLIDEGGLPMVDVRDDGNVPYLHSPVI
jgi:hypothetical protein